MIKKHQKPTKENKAELFQKKVLYISNIKNLDDKKNKKQQVAMRPRLKTAEKVISKNLMNKH